MIIELPPGVVNERSRRSNQANWREANLVRWDNNTLQPVKGWEKLDYASFASPIRAAHRWTDNTGVQHIAYLCEEHCYVDSGEGSVLDITPEGGLTPPAVSGAGGYGDVEYGTDDYGEPRDAVDRLNISTPSYTLDNWGQELRVMTSADGRLLAWDPASPTDVLEPVGNAPTGNRSFLVTPERHIILFGAGGVEQQFMWSDQENDTDWTPSTTSKAGGFWVEPAAPIMTRQLTPAGTLMFTARASYVIRYIGLPYVYSYEKVSDCPPPYSPASSTEIPQGAFWAALNGFWLYNGVNAEPVDCPIWDWIESRINQSASRYRSAMVNIAPKFEVWWFFVGGDDAEEENNHVVIYNYKDKKWSMGQLGRTCGTSLPNDPYPVLASATAIFKHESGFQYQGAPMPWVETHTMNTSRGGRLSTIKRMLPEVDGSIDSVRFRFIKRNNPTSGPEVVSAPKTIKSNGYVDVRETARDFRMRVEMVANGDWSMGPVDMEFTGRGDK